MHQGVLGNRLHRRSEVDRRAGAGDPQRGRSDRALCEFCAARRQAAEERHTQDLHGLPARVHDNPSGPDQRGHLRIHPRRADWASGRGSCTVDRSPSRSRSDDATTLGTTYATRGAQMFLRFTDDELARLARFGEPRSYKAGEMLARVGEVGPRADADPVGQGRGDPARTAASAATSSRTSAAISWASSRSCRAGLIWSMRRR